jgi:multidrug transporter EmrE-like cation transporter
MSLSGFLLICCTALLTAIANVVLTKGIGSAGGFSFDGPASLVTGLIRLFLTPLFLVGFLTYFGASIVWFRVLASEPVITAYPFVVAITFLLVTLASGLILGEPTTLMKMLGLVVIVFGIVIVSLG